MRGRPTLVSTIARQLPPASWAAVCSAILLITIAAVTTIF